MKFIFNAGNTPLRLDKPYIKNFVLNPSNGHMICRYKNQLDIYDLVIDSLGQIISERCNVYWKREPCDFCFSSWQEDTVYILDETILLKWNYITNETKILMNNNHIQRHFFKYGIFHIGVNNDDIYIRDSQGPIQTIYKIYPELEIVMTNKIKNVPVDMQYPIQNLKLGNYKLSVGTRIIKNKQCEFTMFVNGKQIKKFKSRRTKPFFQISSNGYLFYNDGFIYKVDFIEQMRKSFSCFLYQYNFMTEELAVLIFFNIVCA